jgi:broad specificity phosphatase PhoE
MTIARSFYFIRHGETDWNVKGILQGHTDIPLNERGLQQAEDAGLFLARLNLPITRLITSELSRAHNTAVILQQHLKINAPIIKHPLLNERHFGAFEGKTKDEMDAYRQKEMKNAHALEENGFPPTPEGESYADFKARIVTTMNGFLNAHPNDQILFVLHGGVYRVLTKICGLEVTHVDNAKPYLFQKEGESLWVLRTL